MPSVNDEIHWKNQDFQAVVNVQPGFNNCRSAWLEQREFFNIYLDTVRDHPLYGIIQDELKLAFNNVVRPNMDQYKPTTPTEVYALFRQTAKPIFVSFNPNTGAIASLNRSDTIYWTDAQSQLASFVYITYNETDFEKLSHTYGNPGRENELKLNFE